MFENFLSFSRGGTPCHVDSFRLLLDIRVSIERMLDQRMLTTLGISFSQGSVLVQLAGGETVSQQDLAKALGCGTSRISRLVHDLPNREWVICRPGSDDRRTRNLSLTPTGLALARQIPSVLAQAGQAVLGRLSVEERRVLGASLARMLDEVRKPRR